MNPDLFQEDPDRLLSDEEELKTLSNLPAPVTTTPLTGNEKQPAQNPQQKFTDLLAQATSQQGPDAEAVALQQQAAATRETPEERRARVMATIAARLGQGMAGIAGARGGFSTKAGDEITQGALTTQTEAQKSRQEQVADLLTTAKARQDQSNLKRQQLIQNIGLAREEMTTPLDMKQKAAQTAQEEARTTMTQQDLVTKQKAEAHLNSPIDDMTKTLLSKVKGMTPDALESLTYRDIEQNPVLKMTLTQATQRPIPINMLGADGLPHNGLRYPDGHIEDLGLGGRGMAPVFQIDPVTGARVLRSKADGTSLGGGSEPATTTDESGKQVSVPVPKTSPNGRKALQISQEGYLKDTQKQREQYQAVMTGYPELEAAAAGNSTALNSLKDQMARAAKGGGALSDFQTRMFEGNKSLAGRLQRMIETGAEGGITQRDAQEFKAVLDNYKSASQRYIKERAQKRISDLHSRGITDATAEDVMGSDASLFGVAQSAQQASSGQPPALQPGQKLQKKGSMWRIVDAQGNTVSQGGQ